MRRGYYPVGPLRLTSGDLFGFADIQSRGEGVQYLTVYPRIIPLVGLALPSRLPFGTLASPQRMFEDPARMRGVREYQAGDSQRRIHWKASAHSDSLLVKQFSPAISLESVLMLNLHADEYERQRRHSASEWAIVVAASVATYLEGRRQAIGLAVHGVDSLTDPTLETLNSAAHQPMIVPPRPGRPHLMKVLELLARAELLEASEPFVAWAQRTAAPLAMGHDCDRYHPQRRRADLPGAAWVGAGRLERGHAGGGALRPLRGGAGAIPTAGLCSLPGGLGGGPGPVAGPERRPHVGLSRDCAMTQQIDDLSAASKADSLQDATWQRLIGRPLLIAVQATCLVAGLWVIALNISETPNDLRFVPIVVFVAALAGVGSAQWLAQPAQRLVGRTGFQLAQLLLLLAVLRALTWGMTGNWPTLASLRSWILEPWTFFDGVFLAVSLLTALAWHRGAVVAGIFYRLALTPGELAYDNERRAGAFWRTGHLPERSLVSRVDLVEQYATQWMFGGVFLALCAAATRVHIGERLSLNVLDTGIPAPLVVAMVLYFLIGLALLSQARLAMLRAQWLLDGVEMPERLPSRWGRWSLLVIVAIGLLAALLPLGSTWQLGAIVNAVVMFFVRIMLFIIFLIVSVFTLIMSLFGEQPAMPEMPQELVPAIPQEPIVPLMVAPPWLGGATLWLVVLLVLLLALRLLLGRDGLDVTRRKLQLLLANLWVYLKSWGRGVQNLARSIQISLPGRRAAANDEAAHQPWRFVRLSGLPPREQVRYFYLSTLRRAADQGIVRQPGQTPREFVHDLEQTWPEAELDVEALTEAFVIARYDAAEISPDEAQQVKSVWERIKRALRGKRTGGPHTPVE